VKGKILNFFKSYFTDRTIVVENGKFISDPQPLDRGEPQGSSLSGWLFITYINDTSKNLKSKSSLNADDVALKSIAKDMKTLQEQLQQDMDRLQEWCKNNRMVINEDKTKIVIFKSNRKIINEEITIEVNKKKIERAETFKYLGVLLDHNMNWEAQYSSVSNKMTQRVLLISRHKNSISYKWMSVLSSALVLSILDYCFAVWGTIAKTKYERLDNIKIKLAKIVLPKQHVRSKDKFYILEKVNWLTSQERYEHTLIPFVFRHTARNTSYTQLMKK